MKVVVVMKHDNRIKKKKRGKPLSLCKKKNKNVFVAIEFNLTILNQRFFDSKFSVVT